MRGWTQPWGRFVREEDGATMVEYGMMVGLICGVCIGAVTFFGQATLGLFQANDNSLVKTLQK